MRAFTRDLRGDPPKTHTRPDVGARRPSIIRKRGSRSAGVQDIAPRHFARAGQGVCEPEVPEVRHGEAQDAPDARRCKLHKHRSRRERGGPGAGESRTEPARERRRRDGHDRHERQYRNRRRDHARVERSHAGQKCVRRRRGLRKREKRKKNRREARRLESVRGRGGGERRECRKRSKREARAGNGGRAVFAARGGAGAARDARTFRKERGGNDACGEQQQGQKRAADLSCKKQRARNRTRERCRGGSGRDFASYRPENGGDGEKRAENEKRRESSVAGESARFGKKRVLQNRSDMHQHDGGKEKQRGNRFCGGFGKRRASDGHETAEHHPVRLVQDFRFSGECVIPAGGTNPLRTAWGLS